MTFETTPPALDPDARRRRRNRIILGCLAVALLVIVALGISAFLGLRAFVSWGIATDLTDYIANVERSDLDDEQKAEVIPRLESLRDRAKSGERVTFFEWLPYDRAILSLIADQQITEDELQALHDELDRLESDI